MSRYTKAHDDFRQQNTAALKNVMTRLNQIPAQILKGAVKEAFRAAVESTTQDSGNAAWHWTVTGLRSRERVNPRLDFQVRYGMTPIGHRGDKGSNAMAVNGDVLAAGFAEIDRLIDVDGRKAIVIANTLKLDDQKATAIYKARALSQGGNDVTRAAFAAARMGAYKARLLASRGMK
jgi:hypothetical protein